VTWTGGSASTPPWRGCISTARPLGGRSARAGGPRRRRCRTQGAPPNDKSSRGRRREPDDHGIGRSRGGLTTKTHALVDGRGRPLVIAVTPGQAGDSTQLLPLLAALRVPRQGPGRPRTRPTALRGDKAYSSRGHRANLRARGITAVIPEPADQAGHRTKRGSRGGRPVSYDLEDYKQRNVIERAFNRLKQWRGLATRYDKYAVVYRGGVVLASILLWLR
jgi:transposase